MERESNHSNDESDPSDALDLIRAAHTQSRAVSTPTDQAITRRNHNDEAPLTQHGLRSGSEPKDEAAILAATQAAEVALRAPRTSSILSLPGDGDTSTAATATAAEWEKAHRTTSPFPTGQEMWKQQQPLPAHGSEHASGYDGHKVSEKAAKMDSRETSTIQNSATRTLSERDVAVQEKARASRSPHMPPDTNYTGGSTDKKIGTQQGIGRAQQADQRSIQKRHLPQPVAGASKEATPMLDGATSEELNDRSISASMEQLFPLTGAPALRRVEGEQHAAARAEIIRPGAVHMPGYAQRATSQDAHAGIDGMDGYDAGFDDIEASNDGGPTGGVGATNQTSSSSTDANHVEGYGDVPVLEATLVEEGRQAGNARKTERLRELELRTQRLEAEHQTLLQRQQGQPQQRQPDAHNANMDLAEDAASNDVSQSALHRITATEPESKSPMPLHSATPIKETGNATVCGFKRRPFIFSVALVVISIIVVSVVVATQLGPSSSNADPKSTTVDDPGTATPTQSPTNAPTQLPSMPPTTASQLLADRRINRLMELLHPNATADELETLTSTTTVQNKALRWLAAEDPAELDFETISVRWLWERYFMAMFYYQHDGSNWNIAFGWLTGDDACTWQGIECSTTSNTVITIGMELNGLKNPMLTEMGLLQDLEFINFSFNPLGGQIPTEIGQLTKLTKLIIQNSDITGKIPTEIGKLEVLKTLAFAFNTQLSGTFPTELHTLPSINELYLTNTGITGTVDPLVCDISKNNNVPKIGGEYLADCLQGTPKVTCTCCDMCCGATKCCDYVGDDGCFPLTEYWDD